MKVKKKIIPPEWRSFIWPVMDFLGIMILLISMGLIVYAFGESNGYRKGYHDAKQWFSHDAGD